MLILNGKISWKGYVSSFTRALTGKKWCQSKLGDSSKPMTLQGEKVFMIFQFLMEAWIFRIQREVARPVLLLSALFPESGLSFLKTVRNLF